MPPTKEGFTVKLSRLLAVLALIAGLAATAPAAATEPGREGPLRPEFLGSACTVITGTYVEDRLANACEVSDGAFVCVDRCEYQLTALREDLPPLKESCELSRGTFREVIRAEWACDLNGGAVITVTCPLELDPGTARLVSWQNRQALMVCGIRWIPSEQPMS